MAEYDNNCDLVDLVDLFFLAITWCFAFRKDHNDDITWTIEMNATQLYSTE